MADTFDDLAVALDPAFHERQRNELVARLLAPGPSPRLSDSEEGGDLVVIELAPSQGQTMARRRRWATVAMAAVVATAVVVVALARTGHDPAPVGPPSTTIQDARLGPRRTATGSSVTIGFLTDGGTAAGAEGADVAGARAAAAYVNDHLGGVDGHPIDVAVCAADDATTTVPCVGDLVARDVPAVVLADVRTSSVMESMVGPAGMPVVSYRAPQDGSGRTSGSFVLSNRLASFAGPAQLAAQTGARRVLVVVAGGFDNGRSQSDAQSLLRPLYARAGITASFELLGSDAGGVSSAVTAAVAANPDFVHIVGPGICASTLIALRSVAFAGTIAGAPDCVGPVVAARIPGGAAGVRVFSSESVDPADAEVARYRAVMATYAPGVNADVTLAADGYAAIIGFARALTGLQGDITPATVRAAMHSMAAQTTPLLAAQTFRCDGTQVDGDPVACSRATVVATLDANGTPQNPTPIDIARIVGP